MGGETVIIVSAAVIISKGKILITKRNENMKLPSLWEFPGASKRKRNPRRMCD